MFNNFTLSRVEPRDQTLTPGFSDKDSIVMVHTAETHPPPPLPVEGGYQRWRVRRSSSVERTPVTQPRLARTNSIYDGAYDSESDSSCYSSMSDSDFDEAVNSIDNRRHSEPSIHSMADLDMVKFLVRPKSSTLHTSVSNDTALKKEKIFYFSDLILHVLVVQRFMISQ